MRDSLALVLLLLPVAVVVAQLEPSRLAPPKAKKVPVVSELHGDRRVDDYHWLRNKGQKDVTEYLEAENAYTQATMAHTKSLQEKLYAEIVGRIKETDLDVPVFKRGFWYYTRTEKGKSYPIYCRRAKTMDSPEEVMIDLNVLGKDEKYISIGAFEVSDDGNLLAYSVDTTGFREYQLFIKDLRTGKVLADRVGKVNQVEWATDNQTIFLVTEDDAKRWNKVWRYKIGSKAKPTPIYEEKDRLYWFFINRSRDGHYLFLNSASSETSEVRHIPSAAPASKPTLVLAREENHEYYVDHRNGVFYIRTNDKGRNFRLVSAPAASPDRSHWKELIPHRDDVMLTGADLYARYMAVSERAGGFPRVRVTTFANYWTQEIETPERVCSIGLADNPDYQTKTLRYSYTSYQTPRSVYEYDPESNASKLLKQTPVLGGFDGRDYVSELHYATARDGVRVPISLVYRKGTKPSANTPLFLEAYGSYGAPSFPGFSLSRISLLDRGVIYATAHVRGGGEMGTKWHDEGKMMKKMNTFFDFIDCADHLVKQGYTSHQKLAMTGGSAGGLLMGAVLNLRPDLCLAAVVDVPFVDVLNTMLDDSLPLTTGEWLEWGNPNKPDEYAYMRKYCPYTNVEAKAYPNILVNTSINDSQVMYWEPAKWVARLRERKVGDNVLMLKTNMAAGHGGASGRYDAIKETSFDYAFLLWQWGIRD